MSHASSPPRVCNYRKLLELGLKLGYANMDAGIFTPVGCVSAHVRDGMLGTELSVLWVKVSSP